MTEKIEMAAKIFKAVGKKPSKSGVARMFGYSRTAHLERVISKVGLEEFMEGISSSSETTLSTGLGSSSGPYKALTSPPNAYPTNLSPSINQLLSYQMGLPCLDYIPSISTDSETSLSLFIHCLSLGLISNGFPKCDITYATSITSCVLSICRSGTIHHSHKGLRLLESTDATYQFTDLFMRKGCYKPGIKSFDYWTTPLLDDTILPMAWRLFSGIDFTVIVPDASDILIPKSFMVSLRDGRAMVSFLTSIKGVDSFGNYVVTYNEIDRQESRKYNLFSSINSDTRNNLGYINYDISAALQSIVFNFLDVSKYPAHEQMLTDKHLFRENLSNELNISVKAVKVALTAADNGQLKHNLISKSTLFAAYVSETDSIVKEFTDYIVANRPNLYSTAIKYADLSKKYSIFFFIWTQIERQIRDVMSKSFLNQADVREVHDAVYSKEVVDVDDMIRNVSDELGLDIKIEVD